jgi:hypothetical protein
MSLEDERFTSMKNTVEFLKDLLNRLLAELFNCGT